ncbi:MAG: hypothetical protein C0403_14260 [Desulfobacterium sp.]|nr:hypothetical protein [Desulfobacterium sp.]
MLFKKTERINLNGMDCLLMAFDYHMKKNGFAGNLAQMVLGLPVQISESEFMDRISNLMDQFPIIHAVSKRHFFSRLPCWEIDPDHTSDFPRITSYHLEEKAEDNQEFKTLKKKLFNLPLQPKKGEQIRFDLVYFNRGGMEIYMTWVHALMDAHGAEYFLSMIGNPDLEKEALMAESSRGNSGSDNHPVSETGDNDDKWKKAKRSFDHIDRIALNPPVSILSKFPEKAKPVQEYTIMSFSREETKTVLDLARKKCGFFNESTYFAASTMRELKQLYNKKRVLSNNYVLSLPVNLRKKGTHLPVFSNQSTSLLYSFTSESLLDFDSAVIHFKEQTQRAIKTGLLEANVAVMEISKFLPTWFYIRKVRQAMKGEIASIVIANPGSVYSRLSEFMGIPVDYVNHMPAIIAPPGIGVLFYQFSGRLNITFVYTEGILSQEETNGFQQGIRNHLLNGK